MTLVQSMVKIYSGQWLWRKNIFQFRQYRFAISLLTPLLKGCDMSFRESGNPLPDVPSVVKIGLVIIEKEYYHLPFVNWTYCS